MNINMKNFENKKFLIKKIYRLVIWCDLNLLQSIAKGNIFRARPE